MDNKDDFSMVPTEAASKDVQGASEIAGLAEHLAEKEGQANKQRGILFWCILIGTCVMLVIDVVTITCLGLGVIHLDTPVAVAFISAVSIQSFGLISALTFGLYRSSKSPQNSPE